MKPTLSQLITYWVENFKKDFNKGAQLPIEPLSTMSNAFYVFFGLLTITLSPKLIFFGLMLMLLGVASFMYHGTKKVEWQVFDEVMMYTTFYALIFTALASSLIHPIFVIPLTLGASYLNGLGYWNYDSTYNMGFLFIVAVGAILLGGTSLVSIGVITLFFVVAVFLNFGGRSYRDQKFIVFEVSHSLWHWMTAFGLYRLAELSL